jgi:hypothetical protein
VGRAVYNIYFPEIPLWARNWFAQYHAAESRMAESKLPNRCVR